MTKYILHGGYTGKDNESNRSFYKELVRDIPNNSSILSVYFASKDEDNSEKFKGDIETLNRYADGRTFNFLMATQEAFLEQIKQSTVICLHGGDTNKILKILKTYPDLKPLLDGKTVAGSSAGAYALAKFGASHSEEVVREGLGLVPVRVVCHWESPDLPPSATSMAILKDTAPNLELVFLKDCEWRIFND